MSKAQKQRIERLEAELIKVRGAVLNLTIDAMTVKRVEKILHDHDVELLRHITKGDTNA